MKRFPSPKTIGIVLVLTAVAIQPGLSIGIEERETKVPRSYDLDGDGLDDGIDDSSVYPLYCFIHHPKGSDERLIAELSNINGCSILSDFHIIDAVSVMFEKKDAVYKANSLVPAISIELQKAVELYGNRASMSVKASPSSEYSPQTAHDLGFRGEGISIAIIDSGVDNEHPSLEGSFLAGVDFTVPATPLTSRNGSADPDDRIGHGTAVASACLGRGDDDGRGMGVSPEAGLIDLKVMSRVPDQLEPVPSYMVEALQWCVDEKNSTWGDGSTHRGIDLITISTSIGAEDGAVSEAILEAVSSGIPVVLASGNSASSYTDQSQTSWPDGALIVGGLDHKGTVDRSDDVYWSGSTWGPRTDDGDADIYDEMKPDMVAPSVDINFASYSDLSRIQPASGWSSGTGTSYSAAIGAGVVALILESNPSISLKKDPKAIHRIIHQSSEPSGKNYYPLISDRYNVHLGFGSADAFKAVREAREFSYVNHRPEIVQLTAEPEKTSIGGTVEIKATARDIDEDILTYDIDPDQGTVTGEGPIWDWKAPGTTGSYPVKVTVLDQKGGTDSKTISIEVTEETSNSPPDIISFRAEDTFIGIGESTTLTAVVLDADGDDLTFEYNANMGDVEGNDENARYTAPMESGLDTVTLKVTDTKGASDTESLEIEITEGTGNSAPSITLVSVSPSTITLDGDNSTAVLKANVYDPDGLGDIEKVTCDLSDLKIQGEYQLFDDGAGVDENANDGQYSFLIEGLDLVDPGMYMINVTVEDKAGSTSTQGTTLEIIGMGSGNFSKGESSSIDTFVWITGAGILLLIIASAVILLLTRKGRGKGNLRGLQNATQQDPGVQQRVPQQHPQSGYYPSRR